MKSHANLVHLGRVDCIFDMLLRVLERALARTFGCFGTDGRIRLSPTDECCWSLTSLCCGYWRTIPTQYALANDVCDNCSLRKSDMDYSACCTSIASVNITNHRVDLERWRAVGLLVYVAIATGWRTASLVLWNACRRAAKSLAVLREGLAVGVVVNARVPQI